MAKAIITCTGQTINIGDKVRTPDGRVITVHGAAIGQRFYNAEQCTKVSHDTPTDGPATPHAQAVAAESGDSDCVVWGS